MLHHILPPMSISGFTGFTCSSVCFFCLLNLSTNFNLSKPFVCCCFSLCCCLRTFFPFNVLPLLAFLSFCRSTFLLSTLRPYASLLSLTLTLYRVPRSLFRVPCSLYPLLFNLTPFTVCPFLLFAFTFALNLGPLPWPAHEHLLA